MLGACRGKPSPCRPLFRSSPTQTTHVPRRATNEGGRGPILIPWGRDRKKQGCPGGGVSLQRIRDSNAISVAEIVGPSKLPLTRDLKYARAYWETVRVRLVAEGKGMLFRDVYADTPLSEAFSIDHFIPWSFVMHDLIWNLIPVTRSTNSSKGDSVPSLDRYLTPFAKLQHEAVRFAASNRTAADMYIDCFRHDARTLASMPFAEFRSHLMDVIMPLAKVAANQGFESGWVLQAT